MDSLLSVHSFGSAYYHAIEGVEQPELKNELTEECKTQFRRLDRFTQLALLGAARCAGTFSLEQKTALYLASGTGPAGNNIKMQRQIISENEAPSPVQFINSVTNSASFYVMKDHGLSGQNIFVSRHKHAFEAALELAAVDLKAGRVAYALIGIVDEITHPLKHQRRRLDLPEDTPLGEGSHWFLISSFRDEGFTDCLQIKTADVLLGVIEQVNLFRDVECLHEWLASETDPLLVYFDSEVGSNVKEQCLKAMGKSCEFSDDTERRWDGQAAGVVGRFLTGKLTDNDPFSVLLSIGSDNEGRYQVIKARNV